MANRIKGNQDGENGENDSYRIPGRGNNIPRKQIVREIKQGLHPDFGIYTRNGEKYARGKPDNSRKNNVDD